MRNLLAAVALLAFSAPAFAGPPLYPEEADREIVENLPTPYEIDVMGSVMERMVGAVMDIPVGGIVEAMEPGRDLSEAERNRTVRDMATRDDPYAEERMRGSIGAMTAQMGLMTEQFAALVPVLRRSMVDLERRMEEVVAPYDYDHPYDYDWDE